MQNRKYQKVNNNKTDRQAIRNGGAILLKNLHQADQNGLDTPLCSTISLIKYLENEKAIHEDHGQRVKIDNKFYGLSEAIEMLKSDREHKNEYVKLQMKEYIQRFELAVKQFELASQNVEVNEQIIDSLKGLNAILQDEMYSDRRYEGDVKISKRGPDMSKTDYPTIYKDMAAFVEQLASHPRSITATEVDEAEKKLMRKLEGRQTLPQRVLIAIGKVFTVALGVTIGFALGGLSGGLAAPIIGGGVGGMMSAAPFALFKKHQKTPIFYDKECDTGMLLRKEAHPDQHALQALTEIRGTLNRRDLDATHEIKSSDLGNRRPSR